MHCNDEDDAYHLCFTASGVHKAFVILHPRLKARNLINIFDDPKS